ncbi:MAG: FUSC family protein [Anaerorhabdus sp.]|uniref:FUSC family protein n=1 Tax=Anaerorhabdus sp. TaxID=1872524 RepID=UPI003A8B66F1
MSALKSSTDNTTKPKKKFPKLGLRSIKTAISTTLCAIIYILIDRNSTFACIGAVFGMETSTETPWKSGSNRFIGTIIGGCLGMVFFYLQQQTTGKLMQIVFLLIGITCFIILSQFLGYPGAIQGGAVVFYIVMLNTPHDEYISYAINRMIDTGVGVFISILINVLLSRQNLSRYFTFIKE